MESPGKTNSAPTHPIQLLMAAVCQQLSTLNLSPSTTGTLLGFLGEFLGRVRPAWAGKTMVSHGYALMHHTNAITAGLGAQWFLCGRGAGQNLLPTTRSHGVRLGRNKATQQGCQEALASLPVRAFSV